MTHHAKIWRRLTTHFMKIEAWENIRYNLNPHLKIYLLEIIIKLVQKYWKLLCQKIIVITHLDENFQGDNYRNN